MGTDISTSIPSLSEYLSPSPQFFMGNKVTFFLPSMGWLEQLNHG